jgi:CubicO group peptidase (beta-lactamase class C family)
MTAQPNNFDPGAVARVEAFFKAVPADGPGYAVGVVGDGDTLFAGGYGLASLEHGARVTRSTRFYIASVSKQVTALAVLLAVELGRLQLDEPIRRVIPELPAYTQDVSIRHLLNHTSGVREYFDLGLLAGLSPEHSYSESDVLGMIGRQQALNFAPGEDFLYSNSGYVLLAIAVERATGVRLDAFAREAIFGPLGMDASRFQHDHGAAVPDKASGYQRPDGQWRVADCLLDVVGDGGMYASLDDMLAWTKNLLSPRLGAAAIGLMQTAALLRNGASTGYGMGLAIGRHRGLKTVQHPGNHGGHQAHLLIYPDNGLGVVILSNDGGSWPALLASRVAEAFLGGQMTSGPPTSSTLPIEAIRARVASYRSHDGGVTSLVERDGQLLIHGLPVPLSPLSQTSFALAGDRDLFRLDFEPSDGGFVLVQVGGPDRRLQRCAHVEDIDLEPFLGDFESEDVGAGCTLRRGGAGLTVSFAQGREVALSPIGADCLLAADFDFQATLTFDRRYGGFHLDGGRVRKITYRRVTGFGSASPT